MTTSPASRSRGRRRAARRLAAEALYAADVRACAAQQVLREREEAGERVPGYAEALVSEVDARREQIDALLGTHSTGWPVQRMSAVDRNVLRVAVAELLVGGTPPAVVLDEAVAIAKRFSGDEAGRFVNGVLAGIRRSGAVNA